MSIRSLIEINHDFGYRHGPELLQALASYLASGSPDDAVALEPFGIRVLGQRHHSGRFCIRGTPDGFPAHHIDDKRTGR